MKRNLPNPNPDVSPSRPDAKRNAPAKRRVASTIGVPTPTASAEVNDANREQAMFFADAPIGVLWLSSSGRLLRANRALLDLTGLPTGELLGKTLAHIDAFHELRGIFAALLRSGKDVHECRARLQAADGSVRTVLIDAVRRREGRKFVRSEWFVRNITRRVELEREVLSISEREQRRFGQDLHDDICQTLTGVRFRCELLAKSLRGKTGDAAAEAGELAELIGETADRAHEMARGLSPLRLKADGLCGALSELAARTTKLFRGICRFACRKPISVRDDETAVHLYRIAQEAVANAVKHGKPRHVVISLKRERDRIVLSIDDDGRGVPEHSSTAGGMGMSVMQYRAGVINAKLSIQTREPAGTSVVCKAPL